MNDTGKRPPGSFDDCAGSEAANELRRQSTSEAERDVENYRDEYERTEKTGRSRSAGDPEADLEDRD
jgi:hypothetical protein